MKPLLLACLILLLQTAVAQSLDYISVRKANGRVIKNFYAGSTITVQLTDGSFVSGPVQMMRHDSVFVIVYDIRYLPTTWGSYLKDTISTMHVGVPYKTISRIGINRHRSFFQRDVPPLLLLGGSSYIVLNLINNASDKQPVADRKNLRKLGIAAGCFGLGYLLKKLFYSDGFSKKEDKIVYVDLSKKPA